MWRLAKAIYHHRQAVRKRGSSVGCNVRLINQLVKSQPAIQDSWVGKTPWRRDRLPTPVFLGIPGGSVGKESACNAEELG